MAQTHLFNDKRFAWAIPGSQTTHSVCVYPASVSVRACWPCFRACDLCKVTNSLFYERDVLYCAITSFWLINIKMPIILWNDDASMDFWDTNSSFLVSKLLWKFTNPKVWESGPPWLNIWFGTLNSSLDLNTPAGYNFQCILFQEVNFA